MGTERRRSTEKERGRDRDSERRTQRKKQGEKEEEMGRNKRATTKRTGREDAKHDMAATGLIKQVVHLCCIAYKKKKNADFAAKSTTGTTSTSQFFLYDTP